MNSTLYILWMNWCCVKCSVPLLCDGVDVGGAGAHVVVVVVEGTREARGRVVEALFVNLLRNVVSQSYFP